MAAKVVMVAVPTVLGIASIRVYTVSEAPADGLVTREKLNIYTPLPQSAQVQFAPERPGVIESGLRTARESILPFAQAVKGACISVKRGSVNLYYAGQDVYYYLKDPPPGFLPRFGTITMAGLLGMFLARKGSRFKRVAVPLGLMSAGASVCYPAQAVAVLKVTGKKVYAAGRWSSAAVSSLLTPKPQEPPAKDISASQPQSATVSGPESAVVEASEPSAATVGSPQSATTPEPEVESAESLPVSDEPIAAVITEEASSVTLMEVSPDQAPTETNTDPVVHSVPAETETAPPPEEIPAPAASEEPSDTKQAPEDVLNGASPAKSTAILEPDTVKSAPVESTPVEAASVESTVSSEPQTVEAAPVEVAPVEVAPVEVAPVEVAPVEVAPVEAAPVEAAPVEAAPVESTVSSEPQTVEAAPVESTLVEAAPVEAAPVEVAPVEVAPVEVAPVEAAPVEVAPVEAAPVESTMSSEPETVEAAPVESAEIESVPSSEEPPAQKASDEPEVPDVESAEAEPAAQPELADQPPVAAAAETPSPSPEQPAAENTKGGSGFKPDPSLMDFGQSNPEDEDLYSTRS